MGAPEFIILFYIILFALWGYNAGSKREIGSTSGLLLGLFLGFIGLIIVFCSNKLLRHFPVNSPSSADELKKYKELLDAGAISDTEYNIKKAALLNN